jgi:ubiquinone/menaquinone biosynthesis C-methylase UbiE
VAAHVELAGPALGQGLELCCGTGVLSQALQASGWKMTGLDISPGMVAEAGRFIKAVQGDVEALPFKDNELDLVVMRQALFLVGDSQRALKEIHRVLKPQGKLVLSQLIPYTSEDSAHLEKIHRVKQAQLKRFYTRENLKQELEECRFKILESKDVSVRESVSLWMDQAPELSEATRENVRQLVLTAPESYKKHHHVQVEKGEIMEDWDFILYSAQPQKDN